MNVIVIGSGAREHALCRLIYNSPLCDKLYCFPGNYGISQIADCHALNSDQEIIEMCKKIKPDLVLIGPEDYLSRNLAGEIRKLNFNVLEELAPRAPKLMELTVDESLATAINELELL